MAVKTLRQSNTRQIKAGVGALCHNDVHGAARPLAVEGMLLCRHCLTNLDWQRYWTNTHRLILVTMYGEPGVGKSYFMTPNNRVFTGLDFGWDLEEGDYTNGA